MSRSEPDRYAVVGNPVAHSKSPLIHSLFATQTGQSVSYGRLLAPRDGFADTIAAMRAAGMRGANVTVPFKFDAHAACDRLSQRAILAGAVNTLSFSADGIVGDNTDGAGLLADLERLSGSLGGKRILVLGAGGAVAGVVRPLLDAGIASLTILNRTPAKARLLVDDLGAYQAICKLHAGGFEAKSHAVDVIINGTSSGLSNEAPVIDAAWFSHARLAYDMMYGAQPTAFMRHAAGQGVAAADGLGMLVGQAAVSFEIWRGVRPDVEPVLTSLRNMLQARPTAARSGEPA